jgi:hypothetical protein
MDAGNVGRRRPSSRSRYVRCRMAGSPVAQIFLHEFGRGIFLQLATGGDGIPPMSFDYGGKLGESIQSPPLEARAPSVEEAAHLGPAFVTSKPAEGLFQQVRRIQSVASRKERQLLPLRRAMAAAPSPRHFGPHRRVTRREVANSPPSSVVPPQFHPARTPAECLLECSARGWPRSISFVTHTIRR